MRARIIAWAWVAIVTVGVALDTVFTAAHRSLLSGEAWAEHGWPLATLATLGSALMGALVITRYPRHPIGWLLLVPGAAAISLSAEAYHVWVLDGDGPGHERAAHITGWVASLLGGPLALTAISLLFLLSPDGHLPSRRWRWAATAAIGGLTAYTAAVLSIPPSDFEFGAKDFGPVVEALAFGGQVVIGFSVLASAISVALRLRRSRDEVRRQLLWIAASAAFLALGLVVVLFSTLVEGEDPAWWAGLPLYTAYFAFPICVAIAVLRHRLFDIDLIVNRALVVGIATGLVAAGYVLVVVGIGAAVGEGTGGFWPSLLAFAVVAMAFQPLRRWVVRVADRMAYGAAAAPYEALADFSRRLGESPDPATLLPAVAEAACTAVSARRATVRLTVPRGPDDLASWPPGVADGDARGGTETPVVDRGEQLGTITVAMPPGRTLRPGDTQLLRDLADQAAIAFRNARLTAELAHQVHELDQRTRELAESRRRLITAGDAERARVERSIAQRVAPHLRPLPAQLDQLANSGPAPVQPTALAPLVTASATALEELREITRGVFPTQLARSGLEAALRSYLGRSDTGRLTVADSAAGRRFDRSVEAAAYFVVVEAAGELAPPVEVALRAPEDRLEIVVNGQARGVLPLANIRDRVEATGGSMSQRTGGGHSIVEVRLPAQAPVAAAVRQ